MPMSFLQRAVFLGFIAIVLCTFVASSSWHSHARAGAYPTDLSDSQGKKGAATRPQANSPAVSRLGSWAFDPKRDANDYGLCTEQCEAAFPNLWQELDRAVEHRRNIGNITPQDVDVSWREDAIVRAMIYENQLFIVEARGVRKRQDFRQRALGILLSIQRAIQAFSGELPNIEFSFTVDDWAYFDAAMRDPAETPTTWALTRRPQHENLWLMPDFGFYSWPTGPVGEYVEVLNGIAADDVQFRNKKPLAIWRGALMTDERKELMKVVRDKSWADVKEIVWEDEHVKDIMVPMTEHCQYMFPLQTEGRANSGRLKYLLNCHSVVVSHTMEWLEHYHQFLISSGPKQNYVEVKRNFSDLDTVINYFLVHPQEAERIADNSRAIFRDRYLTPAAQACYWRKLFWAWSSVSFEPEFYKIEPSESANPSHLRKILRGVPFETFILLDIYRESPWFDD